LAVMFALHGVALYLIIFYLRTMWELPYNTHYYLLPILCQCWPLSDEICKRALNFIKICIYDSSLVRAVTKYCIQ
jgi:hypothetical protein